MKVSEIKSATVSCVNLDDSLSFWRDVMEFEVAWRGTMEGEGVERAWSLPPGTKAEVAMLRYEGVETGQVRLVEFSPKGSEFVRTTADDPWAVGVGALDVNVRDPKATFRKLHDAGYRSQHDEPVFYNIGGLEQSEVVFRGPDKVNILLVGAMNYGPEMVREGIMGSFSPLTVVSQFVADMDECIRFYGGGLGLECAFDVWTDDDSRPQINKMVGIPEHADMRLAVYQVADVPDGKHLLLDTRGIDAKEIYQRMSPPNLGIVCVSHETDDLDGLRARLPEFGGVIVSEPTELDFGDGGRTRSFLVRAPRGLLLEFYERNVS